MRAALHHTSTFHFFGLRLTAVLWFLPALFPTSWPRTGGRPDYSAVVDQVSTKPPSRACHYTIPFCQIRGAIQHAEQDAEAQELHAELGEELKKALEDQNGDRVEIPAISPDAIAKSVSGRKGTFDILVVEEEILAVGNKKVVKGTLRIRPVSPPPGHPKQMFFDENSVFEGKITPCIMRPSDDAEQARCRIQIVEEIKDIVFMHDKECHRGIPCSPEN